MSVLGTTAATKWGSMVMNFTYIPLIAMCAYLNLDWESLTLLAILLIIDFVTGIAKVYVINKKNLKSYKAIAGVLAKISVLLIPIVLAIVAKQAQYDMYFFTNTVITMLMLAEAFSIIGNIRSIHQRKEVEEVDAMSFVLSKVSKLLIIILKKD